VARDHKNKAREVQNVSRRRQTVFSRAIRSSVQFGAPADNGFAGRSSDLLDRPRQYRPIRCRAGSTLRSASCRFGTRNWRGIRECGRGLAQQEKALYTGLCVRPTWSMQEGRRNANDAATQAVCRTLTQPWPPYIPSRPHCSGTWSWRKSTGSPLAHCRAWTLSERR
jgi:hypothetical protein